MKANALKKNLLFIIPTLRTGGSERVVYNLTRFMPEEKYNYVIISFHDGLLRENLLSKGCKVFLIKKKPGIDFGVSKQIFHTIKSANIDVINTHHFMSLFYAFIPAKVLHVPIIHVEHSKWEMEGLKYIWRIAFKCIAKRIYCVIAVSNEAYDYMINSVSKKTSVYKIINGIPIDDFDLHIDQEEMRAECGISKDDFVIGCVGNLRPEKNQKMLIQAICHVIQKYNNIKLVLVGDGPCKGELVNLAETLKISNNVIFAGARDDVVKLFKIFDTYCLTSRYEGLPLTIIEAMSSRVPVIGTDVMGIREVISHQKSGLLVELDNYEDLCDKIIYTIENKDKINEIVKRAYIHVKQNYDIETMVLQYHKIFQSSISYE